MSRSKIKNIKSRGGILRGLKNVLEWFSLEARLVNVILLLMIAELVLMFIWGTYYLDFGFKKYCGNSNGSMSGQEGEGQNNNSNLMRYLAGREDAQDEAEQSNVLPGVGELTSFLWGEGNGIGYGAYIDDDPDPLLNEPKVKLEIYEEQISATRVLYLLHVLFGVGE